MSLKNRNVWPYLAIIALSAALIADNVIANPRDGFENGMPGRMEERLTEIQIQIDDFRDYVEGSSADVFDISTAICFSGALGLDAALGLGVNGDLHAGIGTGVDLYGLLDIDAGVGIQGVLDLSAALDVGLEGNVQFCLNAGLLKVDNQGNVQGPGGIVLNNASRSRRSVGDVPAELLNLVEESYDVALSLYDEVPALLNTFDVRPGVILSGIQSVGDFVTKDLGDGITDAMNPSNWDDIVAGLPGGDYVSDQVDSVYAAFADLGDGDVCGFIDGVGGTIDSGVGDVLRTICNAVPAGIDTSIDAMSVTVDVVYTVLTQTISTIYGVVNTTISFLTGTLKPVIDAIKSVVDGIDNVVGDILDIVDI